MRSPALHQSLIAASRGPLAERLTALFLACGSESVVGEGTEIGVAHLNPGNLRGNAAHRPQRTKRHFPQRTATPAAAQSRRIVSKTALRVHGIFADHCPIYRSLGSIQISTESILEALPSAG